MWKWVRRVCLAAAAIVVLLFIWVAIAQPFATGWMLRSRLLSEISDARNVAIVEHSSPWDRLPALGSNDATDAEKVYKKVDLNAEQIAELRGCLIPSLDFSRWGRIMCFEPHHRIEIQHLDGKTTSVEICFHCGNLAINGEDDRIMPLGWSGRFSSFFASLGLRPNADFHAPR